MRKTERREEVSNPTTFPELAPNCNLVAADPHTKDLLNLFSADGWLIAVIGRNDKVDACYLPIVAAIQMAAWTNEPFDWNHKGFRGWLTVACSAQLTRDMYWSMYRDVKVGQWTQIWRDCQKGKG